MIGRHPIANRREAETFEFEHDGVRYVASIGRFDDGSLCELFLNAGKVGSAAGTMARDAAVTFSIARQHGIPVGMLKSALAKLADGSPAGPLGRALEIAGDIG
jgi:hypothetical protein